MPSFPNIGLKYHQNYMKMVLQSDMKLGGYFFYYCPPPKPALRIFTYASSTTFYEIIILESPLHSMA